MQSSGGTNSLRQCQWAAVGPASAHAAAIPLQAACCCPRRTPPSTEPAPAPATAPNTRAAWASMWCLSLACTWQPRGAAEQRSHAPRSSVAAHEAIEPPVVAWRLGHSSADNTDRPPLHAGTLAQGGTPPPCRALQKWRCQPTATPALQRCHHMQKKTAHLLVRPPECIVNPQLQRGVRHNAHKACVQPLQQVWIWHALAMRFSSHSCRNPSKPSSTLRRRPPASP